MTPSPLLLQGSNEQTPRNKEATGVVPSLPRSVTNPTIASKRLPWVFMDTRKGPGRLEGQLQARSAPGKAPVSFLLALIGSLSSMILKT